MHPKNQKNIQKNSIQRRRTVTAARLVAARFRKPSKTEVKAGKYTKKSRKIDKKSSLLYYTLKNTPVYKTLFWLLETKNLKPLNP